MLTHTGRKSGNAHQTVIEVVQHDKETDTYYVVSGWGEKSDWYQNVHKAPSVTVQTGGRKFKSIAEFIPKEKAVDLLAAYAHDHPVAFKELSGLFLGGQEKSSSNAPDLIAKKMPMVAFHPENGS